MPLTKCENFRRAVRRLEEALTEYAANPSSSVLRDGVIQRFEFTFELGWKSLKEYMEDQGAASDLAFPKQVLKTAYAARLIDDEGPWLDMLSSRNVTSHIYDDAQAAQVLADVRDRFMAPLSALAAFYGDVLGVTPGQERGASHAPR